MDKNEVKEEEKKIEETKEEIKEGKIEDGKAEEDVKKKEESKEGIKDKKEEEKKKEKSSFVKTLWSKCDFLHERYRKRYDICCNFIDMLKRLSSATKDYSSSMQTIISKNYKIYLDNENKTSLSIALDQMKLEIAEQAQEFKTISEELKSDCINVFYKLNEDYYYKEKDKYNEFRKAISKYTDAKKALDKAQNNFKLAAQTAEKTTIIAKQLKLNPISGNIIEKEKALQKASSCIQEAIEYENIYKQRVEEADKARIDEIKVETEFLELLQCIEEIYQVKEKEMIHLYNVKFKKATCTMTSNLENLTDSKEAIDTLNDIEALINENKTTAKPDGQISFIPYKPQTKTGTDSDLDFEVLAEIKSKFTDVIPDFDIETERRKTKVRQLSKNVFLMNKEFKEEDKKELLECVKNKEDRLTFLFTLNKQRTTGKYARTPKIMETLKEMLQKILEISEREKDYDSARNCIILSQTFYVQEGDKKVYLFEAISKYPWLLSIDFWENIINYMIKVEINKNEESNKEINESENEDQKRRRLSNIAFSQLLPYSNNMLEFKINKDEILALVKKLSEKYSIEEPMVEAIVGNINAYNK